eukprot:TRINITY_DN6276_c0_g1_i1.p1 TRINITY_DN6276_c0_g1~~TRINITY_DN6276_c0_g1_i1.p1  ORF type:complete len:175 (+),score=27.39 TRINITY_DN6276_c0_g1_i1:45-527(+)
MKLGDVTTTIPTIGMNVETVESRNFQMTAFDVGGRGAVRPLWRHYFQNSDGIVFVVDANDRDRLEEAEYELSRLLTEDELQNVPLLVFANKMDLPNAMPVARVIDQLGLLKIKDRQWNLQPTCMLSGDGMYEGLEWLSDCIAGKFRTQWEESRQAQSTEA